MILISCSGLWCHHGARHFRTHLLYLWMPVVRLVHLTWLSSRWRYSAASGGGSPAAGLVEVESKCRWRAGERLSARNQSEAGVLGLWPTNCTHPRETNWPLSRIIQRGIAASGTEGSTKAQVNHGRVGTALKSLPSNHKAAAGCSRCPTAAHSKDSWYGSVAASGRGWQMVKVCRRHLSLTLFDPFAHHQSQKLNLIKMNWRPCWKKTKCQFSFSPNFNLLVRLVLD